MRDSKVRLGILLTNVLFIVSLAPFYAVSFSLQHASLYYDLLKLCCIAVYYTVKILSYHTALFILNFVLRHYSTTKLV